MKQPSNPLFRGLLGAFDGIVLFLILGAMVGGVTYLIQRKSHWVKVSGVETHCEGHHCDVDFQATNSGPRPLDVTFYVRVNATASNISAGRSSSVLRVVQGGGHMAACLDAHGLQNYQIQFDTEGLGLDRSAEIRVADVKEDCLPANVVR